MLPTTITVTRTKNIAIYIIGRLYSQIFFKDELKPSVNNRGAITNIINISDSNSKWSGRLGIKVTAAPRIIWNKAAGIRGIILLRKEPRITITISIPRVVSISIENSFVIILLFICTNIFYNYLILKSTIIQSERN